LAKSTMDGQGSVSAITAMLSPFLI
ncbi:hypothetical protein CP8484711_0742, partial [Chlamydia psittaci 84-8471/1]